MNWDSSTTTTIIDKINKEHLPKIGIRNTGLLKADPAKILPVLQRREQWNHPVNNKHKIYE